jgi:integrase
VYLSDDAYEALAQYLRVRPASRIKEVFLVDKGRCRGKAISVRGIQKRLEYCARQARLKVSCHQLRHTMATQLLNADAAPGDHPGSPGAHPDQNHATILPGVCLPKTFWGGLGQVYEGKPE